MSTKGRVGGNEGALTGPRREGGGLLGVRRASGVAEGEGHVPPEKEWKFACQERARGFDEG